MIKILDVFKGEVLKDSKQTVYICLYWKQTFRFLYFLIEILYNILIIIDCDLMTLSPVSF